MNPAGFIFQYIQGFSITNIFFFLTDCHSYYVHNCRQFIVHKTLKFLIANAFELPQRKSHVK